ncbi:MAG TPA: phosphoadenylyl-sulfate reductase [Burkholderiales bacterium]|nr:phosphoadenylyl-sulfate reductase [Burkholderiales bacterium]
MNHSQKTMNTVSLLKHISAHHTPAVFANSFGAEDVVLIDLISRHAPGIGIFSLDTGRLPQETYALMQTIRQRYPETEFQIYFPAAAEIEDYVQKNGPDAFYNSIELRKQCCHIRKVEPLNRALTGKKAWVTGLRRDQSTTRQNLLDTEWDELHGLQKFNPLADWTEKEIWDFIQEQNLPYNSLHDKGYPSIGCAPCTRAITRGEDIRAGRWWWENPDSKECGLHPATPLSA